MQITSALVVATLAVGIAAAPVSQVSARDVDDIENGLWARTKGESHASNAIDAAKMLQAKLEQKKVADEHKRNTEALNKAKAKMAAQNAQAAAAAAPKAGSSSQGVFKQATGMFSNIKKQTRSLDALDEEELDMRDLEEDEDVALSARTKGESHASNAIDAAKMLQAKLDQKKVADEHKRNTEAINKVKAKMAAQNAQAAAAAAPKAGSSSQGVFKQATGMFSNIKKQTRSLDALDEEELDMRDLEEDEDVALSARTKGESHASNAIDAAKMLQAKLEQKKVADEHKRNTEAINKVKAKMAAQNAQAAAAAAPKAGSSSQGVFKQATGMFSNIKKQTRSLEDLDEDGFDLAARHKNGGHASNVIDAIQRAHDIYDHKKVVDEHNKKTAASARIRAALHAHRAGTSAAPATPAKPSMFQEAVGMFKHIRKQGRSMADFDDVDFEARSLDDFAVLDFEPRSLEEFDTDDSEPRSLEELD